MKNVNENEMIKMRVRQIKNKALRRLRNKLPCDEFPLD